MILKVSPSLLNNYDFYRDCPISWKEKSWTDIVQTIRREKKFESDAQSRGIRFEEAVEKECKRLQFIVNGDPTDSIPMNGSPEFQNVVSSCMGGAWQEWIRYSFTFEDFQVELIGKSDVLLPEKVIDLKTTTNFKGVKKYLDSNQPPAYLLATGKKQFEFIIAEWQDKEDPTSTKIKDIHNALYVAEPMMEMNFHKKFSDFIAFVRSKDLFEDYLYTYSKNAR